MSKPTSKYPEDEFDAVEPGTAPSGVHRAPRSTWSRVAPFVVVMVTCAVLAVGTVYYLAQSPTSRLNTPPPAATAAAEPTADAGAATPDATDAVTPDAEPADEATTEPADEATDEATAEPEEPVEPPAEVADTTTSIRVLNATGRSGVAAGAAETLTDAGWSDVVADNFTGTEPTSSLVYFKDSTSEASAREVAQLLGITQVIEAPKLVGPVSVVLVGSFGN